MEALKQLTYLFLFAFGFVQSSVLPVEKCALTDKACLITSAQKMLPIFAPGMPEYDVEVLDPLAMNDVKFDLSGLKFSLSGGVLKGLKNGVIDDIDVDLEKHVIGLTFHTDASMKGHYTASGQVLILPITGDGQMKLKLKNMEIKIFLHYEKVKNGEKEYFKIKKHDFKFEVKDGANFNLTNLFNGNKELSDAMLLFLNQNWQQISVEFGTPLVDSAVNHLVKAIDWTPRFQTKRKRGRQRKR